MIGYVKSCGQKDLSDDGKHRLDDGIRSGLDREYPNWKKPEGTYMVPDFLQTKDNDDSGENAEKKVYTLLEQLGKQNNEQMFVVHSYDFSEHIPGSGRKRSWVMGESDFVIVHRDHGPMFIQVKATESGAKYKDAEDQLRKDKLALEKFFQKLVKGNISTKKAIEVFKNVPAFVAMPNCQRGQSTCTRENVLYKEDCASLEAFCEWWTKKIRSAEHPAVDQTIYEYLVMSFVGYVMVSPCLPSGSCIDGTYKFLKFNTREQLKVLLDSSPEKWIVGPAGSGKTSLLMEKVTNLAENIILHSLNEKILVVCYNKPLSVMLSTSFENELRDMLQGDELCSVVDVKTFDKLLKDINGPSFNVKDGAKGVIKALEILKQSTSSERSSYSYEHIFVDEGQDLYSAKWPTLLQMLHRTSKDPAVEDDDFEPKFFWVFFDSNQHLHLSKEQISLHSKNLTNSTRLFQVLRNTKNIFVQFKKYFEPIVKHSSPATAVGVYHREDGLKIKWDDSLQSEEVSADGSGEQSIVRHLKYLQRNGVQNRNICIIVRDTNDQTLNLDLGVEIQDAVQLWTKPDNNKLVVESIRRFKGLESKVVILYNPPFYLSNAVNKTRELLYTAFSRCLCYLIVISTKEGCEALQSVAGLISANQHSCPPTGSDNEGTPSTSQEFPPKRPYKEDGCTSDYHVLYKKMKEITGNAESHLLGPGTNNIGSSLRMEEHDKLLPSVFLNLQLHPEYKDVNQSDLRKIVALLEYRVLTGCRTGNQVQYKKDMKDMKQAIDSSTQRSEVNSHVAGALALR